ncbi:hypothetical protein HDU92_008478, partial [Lobulomyces angularis]
MKNQSTSTINHSIFDKIQLKFLKNLKSKISSKDIDNLSKIPEENSFTNSNQQQQSIPSAPLPIPIIIHSSNSSFQSSMNLNSPNVDSSETIPNSLQSELSNSTCCSLSSITEHQSIHTLNKQSSFSQSRSTKVPIRLNKRRSSVLDGVLIHQGITINLDNFTFQDLNTNKSETQ